MIEVDSLTKVFDRGTTALHGVSFSARSGGVLGFLGANGAGKTTAMRILAGYLRPTSGRAAICGHDVVTQSLLARRKVGYLPEQVPLYKEMRAAEYLRYRAELKGLGRSQRKAAVAEALELAGLAGQEERVIGKLSKGFRQRVGLADALLGRPEVLILDEPTDGLDPRQRREVLDLIAGLAKERTVVLSTHVLPEVESVCRELLILDQGRVAAAGPTADLLRRLHQHGQIEVRCRGDRAALVAAVGPLPDVLEVQAREEADEVRLLVRLAPAADVDRACEALARAVLSAGELRRLAPARSGLEALFRSVTKELPAP
jgi:ABC-2 type transport system ATP-binding protein